MLRNLTPGTYNEEDIRVMFENYYNQLALSDEERKRGLGLKKVVLAYNIGDFIELVRKRNMLDKKWRDALSKRVAPKGVDTEAMRQEIDEIQKKIDSLEDEATVGSKEKACGVAFVTFNSEDGNPLLVFTIFFLNKIISFLRVVVADLLERCKINAKGLMSSRIKSFIFCRQTYREYLTYQGSLVYVERAPEPNDILWENLGYPAFHKMKRRIVTSAFTVLLLAVCFAAIFGISYLQVIIYNITFLRVSKRYYIF
jgi:hypothetical protein